MKSETLTVPIVDCRGEILEMSIPSGDGSYLRKDCRFHGAEIYRKMTIYLENSAIPGKRVVVDVFLSEDFMPKVDRHELLNHVMGNPDKKAWLFAYAKHFSIA